MWHHCQHTRGVHSECLVPPINATVLNTGLGKDAVMISTKNLPSHPRYASTVQQRRDIRRKGGFLLHSLQGLYAM